MDLQAWLPIFGVLLGWILSQVASHYRDTREARKLLSIANSSLLYVYFDRVRYRRILAIINARLGDKLKEISGLDISSEEKLSKNDDLLKEVESARRALLVDHPDTESRSRESLSKALEALSKVDSLISYKARSLIEDDHLYRNINLNGLLNNPLLYLESYGSLLGSVESFNDELLQLIKFTSFRHSLLCYVRTLLFLWHENSKLESSDERANRFFNAFEAPNRENDELKKQIKKISHEETTT